MNTRLDYLWEKVSLFTQFSDLAKIFEPIFFKISLKTGPIFDHPLLVKIGSEIRKSVQNRKTDIFSSPGADPDLLASSEAVIWIYAFAKAEYIQLSRTRVNDTSALVGYFMPSPRERVKRHEELLGDRKEG